MNTPENLIADLKAISWNTSFEMHFGTMASPSEVIYPFTFSLQAMTRNRSLTKIPLNKAVLELKEEIKFDHLLMARRGIRASKYGFFIYQINETFIRYAKTISISPMSQFSQDIKKFNDIYKLPVEAKPTLTAVSDPVSRLKAFKNILAEELDEIDEVIALIEIDKVNPIDLKLTALTALADLLGDIQVYCASEMAKFGIPLDKTLAIIMESNFSKLGADGLPIYDERGKVQKGPNYWKPEPKLEAMLKAML